MKKHDAALALEDGKVFFGWGFGHRGVSAGELCFSTSQTGYQETITDPSYRGQIIVFAFPHVGNVGVNKDDMESTNANASGVVVNCEPTYPSNWRSEDSLQNFLSHYKVPGIWGVDTREIIRHIRDSGCQNAALVYGNDFTNDQSKLTALAKSAPEYDEVDFIKQVTCKEHFMYAKGKHNVVVLDFGVKLNILRLLAKNRLGVVVLPAASTFDEIMSHNPSGIVISNGPGNPNNIEAEIIETARKIVETDLPILGICLGFQILAIALGNKITKMKTGHRGINQPSYNLSDKYVAIGSHNHGFSLCKENMHSSIQPLSISLFDGCIESFSAKNGRVIAIQYHPEASPGPQENAHIFSDFANTVREHAC